MKEKIFGNLGKKHCSDCGKIKSTDNFTTRRKGGRLYKKSQCKVCDVIRTKKWVAANREKFNDYHRKYYHDNS